MFTNLSLVSYRTVCSYYSPNENCVNATELPFNTLQNFVYSSQFIVCAHEFSLAERTFKEKSPFVQVNYRSTRREISCELSSKNHGNKEQNSHISLALLLHNTVPKQFCRFHFGVLFISVPTENAGFGSALWSSSSVLFLPHDVCAGRQMIKFTTL